MDILGLIAFLYVHTPGVVGGMLVAICVNTSLCACAHGCLREGAEVGVYALVSFVLTGLWWRDAADTAGMQAGIVCFLSFLAGVLFTGVVLHEALEALGARRS